VPKLKWHYPKEKKNGLGSFLSPITVYNLIM